MSDSVAVDAAAPLTFGGDVSTVLESPRSTMPPPTLEEARNQPGRRERIEAITKLIEAQGIKYVFFEDPDGNGWGIQQLSQSLEGRRAALAAADGPRGAPETA